LIASPTTAVGKPAQTLSNFSSRIQAKDKSDKPIVMIVDTLTMIAVQIQSPSEGETTGNGPSEDADRR
jgi:hypothetical protein